MRVPVLITAVLVTLAVAAGCGGGDDPGPTPPAPAGTAHFVGTDPDGLGAVVDFAAEDPVLDALRAAVDATPGRSVPVWLGAVALVNRGSTSAAVPRFVAVLPDGGAVPLDQPRAPRLAIPGVDSLAPAGPLLIPPQGAGTVYVALRGVPPRAVDHLRMVVRRGVSVRLDARPR